MRAADRGDKRKRSRCINAIELVTLKLQTGQSTRRKAAMDVGRAIRARLDNRFLYIPIAAPCPESITRNEAEKMVRRWPRSTIRSSSRRRKELRRSSRKDLINGPSVYDFCYWCRISGIASLDFAHPSPLLAPPLLSPRFFLSESPRVLFSFFFFFTYIYVFRSLRRRITASRNFRPTRIKPEI